MRNVRKAIGNSAWRSVCGLKSISVSPAVNIGSVARWYSMGVNV